MTAPDLEARVALAASLVERRLSHQAVETLREVLGLDPDHPVAHALLSRALLDLGRLYAANHEASRALTCDPDCFEAHRAAAMVCIAQRRFEQAQFHLTWCLDQRRGDPDGLALLGRLRALQDRAEDAKQVLEEALARAPDNLLATVARGRLAMADGDLVLASQRAETGLRQNPEDPDALVLKGRIRLQQGSVDDARQHAVWALRSDANHSDARALLAESKARDSVAASVWWRFNTWMGELGSLRSIVVLVGSYLAFRLMRLVLTDLDLLALRSALEVVWVVVLAGVAFAPGIFRQTLDGELGQVKLRDDP